MSLLQDVLRSHTDTLDKNLSLASLRVTSPSGDDSEDELVNVVSLPGTPTRSRPSSRPPSPTKGASARPLPKPLHLHGSQSHDPLKVLPTEVSQRIFGRLGISDLARCARVSRKWNRSQTINYVWFQHYRKENFHDDSLPPGKWSKRESKQNWRVVYIQSTVQRSPHLGPINGRSSGRSSPSLSGQQTPRELKEEKWRLEAEGALKPGKLEMREMYKDLGGRKFRGKTKLGSTGIRDKGGWGEVAGDW